MVQEDIIIYIYIYIYIIIYYNGKKSLIYKIFRIILVINY